MADDGGLGTFQRRMRAIPVAVKEAARAAMAKGADEIVAAAKAYAPVDDGALQDSIGWTWGDAPEGSFAIATQGTGDLRITIYAGNKDAFYARWVEFGTTENTAQPFFFPAYRLLKKRTANRVKRAINKAIRKAWAS
ncbi:HK97-gp10 family putative phage morphogenesis protein [Rhizobium sp. BE258]|uniref:HK97-gp10 family putative phage morphogenesis protein n=1 Tax=Rhizobium sp. BE258 TaxID=2817722 RepID=UPI002857BFE1|nr:HK97-gp10 family putative phage morphogenesis protein [Rhizobium sp. BE258]MDR7147054.1 HK97 gp10 family phage protein [Rhizobium sp. BE258]